MTVEAQQRLWGAGNAFDHPVTVGIVVAVGVGWLTAWIAVWVLGAMRRWQPATRRELNLRLRTWAILIPLMVGPVLLGAGWTIAAVAVLGLLCYREFARATGLFRNRTISVLVVVGLLAVTLATADHWYGLFAALPALGCVVIAAVAVLPDQPKGYIQRVALGCFGFLLFGVCLGHVGYMANDADYRPILLLLLLSVELNDVFAYVAGKTFGHRKLAPHTSPGKTIGGMLGALMGTTVLVAVLGHAVFAGSGMDHSVRLVGLGLIVSVAGQLGDLVLSSIKRDIGIKDMGQTLPGHGGLLDRFDSLILVAPACFHYIGYFRGFGLDQATRVFTGG